MSSALPGSYIHVSSIAAGLVLCDQQWNAWSLSTQGIGPWEIRWSILPPRSAGGPRRLMWENLSKPLRAHLGDNLNASFCCTSLRLCMWHNPRQGPLIYIYLSLSAVASGKLFVRLLSTYSISVILVAQPISPHIESWLLCILLIFCCVCFSTLNVLEMFTQYSFYLIFGVESDTIFQGKLVNGLSYLQQQNI
jgi:hypothetical protein